MPFDYWLIGGSLLLILGILRYLAAIADQTSIRFAFLLLVSGVGCLAYAWVLAEGDIKSTTFAEALFRIMGQYINKGDT